MRYDSDDSEHFIEGRPDFADHSFGVTRAKKFPPYVFSTTGNACLVHKIVYVEMRWYRADYHRLVRLQRPRLIAHTACGNSRFLTGHSARTCIVPNPDALLCGRCHGDVATFGKEGPARKAGITVQQAHVKLGCVVKGY